MRLFILAIISLTLSIPAFAGCCNNAGNNVPGYSLCPNNPNQCCNNAGQSNNNINPQNCNSATNGGNNGGSSSCPAPGFLVPHTSVTTSSYGSNQLGTICKIYMGNNPGTTQCCITWQQVQSACDAESATLVNLAGCSNSTHVFGPVTNQNITKTCCKP